MSVDCRKHVLAFDVVMDMQFLVVDLSARPEQEETVL
jgi:hypothetical protein